MTYNQLLYVMNDLPVPFLYEGWKFNSGNYLFTTDTK